MNFWLALALGFIIGWLIEWLIDWFFWRAQWKTLRADLETAQAENAALSGQRQRAFDLERQLVAAQEKLATEQAARTAADKQVADLTKFKTAAEADLAKLKADVPTLQADLAAARAALAEATAENSRLAASAGTLATLELRYQTEANLRTAAETSEAQLRARVAEVAAERSRLAVAVGTLAALELRYQTEANLRAAAETSEAQLRARVATLTSELTAANDPLAGGIHFSAPLGDDADGLADRSVLADAAQWEARLAELEAAANDPLAGGIHFSAPMGGDAQTDGQLIDLKLKLSETLPDDVSFGVPFTEDDGLAERSALGDAAQWEARLAELETAASDPLAGGIHFSAPLGDDADGLADRSALADAAQWEARLAELEAAANDPLAGGIHFSAPMGGDAQTDDQLIDLKLKLSETLPDDVSFGVPFTEDDGLAERSALGDAAQWEARLAELETAASDPLAGGVHFSAPMGDESALNDLRDAHLAEMQAAIRLAAEAQAEADRLRAQVAALTSELETATSDPLAGGVHFSAPMGDAEATTDPDLERLQAELAYDRAAVNFAVQLDEEAAALRTRVAELEAAANDPLAGGIHFSAPMETDGQLIDLKLKLSETLPDDVSFGVPFADDDGLAERSALGDAAQWEARLAELETAANDPLAGGVHFSAPMGDPSGSDDAEAAALRQRVAELELRLSETAPLPTETASATEDFGAVHFSAPGFEEDTSALADHELAALQNQLAADRAAALDLPDTDAPEAVHFSAPFAEDPTPAADDLSFLTPGGCAHTDPLEDINGIGEVFAKRLREAGVCTFAQLARLTPAQARRLAKVKDWQKVEPEKWIEEAATFARRSA